MRVEFEIWLKDMLSGGVRKMGATTQSVFGGMSRSIDETKKRIDELTKTRNISVNYSDVKAANREIESLQRNLRETERMGSRGNGGGFGGVRSMAAGVMLGGMAMTGISMAANAAVQGVKTVATSGMEGGAQRSQFEVMGGQEAGGQLFGDLTKYINDSIFGKSLYQDASTLMGFGDQVKNVMPDLKMLGDVSRGNGQRMSSLSLVYGQTMAAGKLTGGDQLQYIAAGFNPLQEISRTTGKSMATLRDEMSDGKITFDMVRDAFKSATSEGGRFYGMLDKIQKTAFGKKDAMIGNVEGAVMGFGMKLEPLMNRMMDRIKPMVDHLPAMFDRMVPVLETIYTRFEEIGPSMASFAGELMNVLKPIGALMLSDGMSHFATSMLGLAGDITHTLIPAVDGMAASLSVLLGMVGYVTDALRSVADWASLFGNNRQNSAISFNSIADEAFKNLVRKTYGADKFVGGKLPMVPKSMYTPVSAGKANTSSSSATDSDAIVGGGRKVVNINFRNFIEHLDIHSATTGEGTTQTEQQLKELFVRLLRSAEGALG